MLAGFSDANQVKGKINVNRKSKCNERRRSTIYYIAEEYVI